MATCKNRGREDAGPGEEHVLELGLPGQPGVLIAKAMPQGVEIIRATTRKIPSSYCASCVAPMTYASATT
jgi:hypothetical protein